MPRKAKRTESGAPAQPVSEIPGQTYGANVAQVQLQQMMPSPDVRAAQQAPAATGAAPAPGAIASAPPAPPVDVTALARGLAGRTGAFLAPGDPSIPVTAGLSSGPGPGREALQGQAGSVVGSTLRRLSATLNDPSFAELARKVGL